MDPYRVLKVSPDAPDEVIRAAYKVLASKYHPDKNPGNAQAARTMQHVNDAYALLSDPKRRSEYDHKAKAEPPPPSPEPQKSSFKKVTIHCHHCSCAMRVPEEVLADPVGFNVTCPDCRKDPFSEPVRYAEPPAEPSKSTIDCKHCGQSIRVLTDAIRHPDRFEVKCPKCHHDPIPRAGEHRYEQRPAPKPPIDLSRHIGAFFRGVMDLIKVGVGIAVIIAALGAVLDYFNRDRPPQTQSSAPPARAPSLPQTPAPPVFSQPVQPLPQTGDNTASFSNGVAPLTIKTSAAGGNHYFVKIASVGSGVELGSYFIRRS